MRMEVEAKMMRVSENEDEGKEAVNTATKAKERSSTTNPEPASQEHNIIFTV